MLTRDGIFTVKTFLTFFSRFLRFGAGQWRPGLRSRLSIVLALEILLLLVSSVCAETDALIHAAGFALTGSAKLDTKVIGEPAECVFGIKNDLFRLNNVYTDLIKIEAHQKQRLGVLEQWVTVRLQGAGVVLETTIEPPQDDGSELMRQMRMQSPELFRPHHYTYTNYELHLPTKDQDGVKLAWQYVYSHGCTGKQSPL